MNNVGLSGSLFTYFLHLSFIYVCVCFMSVEAGGQLWNWFSPSTEDRTQVIRPGSTSCYSRSHLTGPLFSLLRAGDTVQLVECLLDIHDALG